MVTSFADLLAVLMVFGERCCLVMLFFPFSALDKILNFREATGQAAQAVSIRALAAALVLGGLGIELFMSLAVLTGFADRLAALILALYCMVTALLWKQFWRTGDFRFAGESRGREVFWDFLKNFAVAGGFLMLSFGPNTGSAKRFIDHPLASTHPYTAGPRRHS